MGMTEQYRLGVLGNYAVGEYFTILLIIYTSAYLYLNRQNIYDPYTYHW